jgi:hypothetical protein
LPIAVYGVYQKISLPSWDLFYISVVNSTGGISEDFNASLTTGIFSSTTGRQQFACFISACLMILIFDKLNFLSLVCIPLGTFTLILSQSRAVWLSFFVSISIYLFLTKKDIKKVLIFIFLSFLTILLGLSLDFSAESIDTRINSLSNTEGDYSLNARKVAYQELTLRALTSVFGKGLGFDIRIFDAGIGNFDGSILQMLFFLGWLGILAYMLGILILFYSFIVFPLPKMDSFLTASFAIVMGIFSQIGFNLIFIESPAIIMWAFGGMCLAGREYYYSCMEKSYPK